VTAPGTQVNATGEGAAVDAPYTSVASEGGNTAVVNPWATVVNTQEGTYVDVSFRPASACVVGTTRVDKRHPSSACPP